MNGRTSPPTHPLHSQSRLLTGKQAKHLLDLCRTGQLYAIEAWIAAGKSLRVPSSVRTSPLEIAVSTGFHSLVEVLVKNIDDPEELNDVELLQDYRPSWAPIRQWAGHDAAIAIREERIQRLERLVWDAVYALQRGHLDKEADRLRRAQEKL